MKSSFVQEHCSYVPKVFYAYTYGTAAWLVLQAVPIMVAPKLILHVLSPEGHHSTDLEVYFSRFSALTLLCLTMMLLLLTGSIPLSAASAPISMEDSELEAPYAVPTIRVTMIFQVAAAVYCYVRYVSSGQLGFTLGTAGYAIMSLVGLWCIMFATSGGRISKRTGADKRTSGFPFKNAEADKRKAGRKRL